MIDRKHTLIQILLITIDYRCMYFDDGNYSLNTSRNFTLSLFMILSSTNGESNVNEVQII